MKVEFNTLKTSSKEFEAIIEIPKGSKNKYEFDSNTGLIFLDRILYTSTHYPHNYGFIPNTLAEDGDSLDVLVISSEVMLAPSYVKCKPIGVLRMIDGGIKDYKILAVPLSDPFYNIYKDVKELPLHISDEIIHFFRVYKTLETNKETVIIDIEGHEKAEKVIENCIIDFKKSKK
ncbi:MAG: inorganic diphosphatase [Bacilli bacterium]